MFSHTELTSTVYPCAANQRRQLLHHIRSLIQLTSELQSDIPDIPVDSAPTGEFETYPGGRVGVLNPRWSPIHGIEC